MRRGLTLIETLILLALMSLLISLVAPALSQSRLQARAIKCLSNLRQIGELHQSEFGNATWGTSAYDIGGLGSDDARPDRGRDFPDNGDGPIHVKDRSQNRYKGQFDEFYLWMEASAPAQPLGWDLACPSALEQHRNSYGIDFRSVNANFERRSTSRDVIFGDSDYKVVDVPRNYHARHFGKIAFYFGDHHLTLARAGEVFSAYEMNRMSRRPPPDGLGH